MNHAPYGQAVASNECGVQAAPRMSAQRSGRVVLDFGPAERRMVGVLQKASVAGEAEPAVLFCPSMGQEALRGYRLFVVLADRLSRAGVASLRFDLHGTGDSSGDDLDGDLEGWVEDLLVADDELRRARPGGPVVWIALRLGAALCAMASRSARQRPDALLFVDPVVDGPCYLAELQRADRLGLMRTFGADPARYRAYASAQPSGAPTEALGYGLSERLLDQLRTLGLHTYSGLRAGVLHVAAVDADGACRSMIELTTRAGVPSRATRLEQRIDWTSNDAAGYDYSPLEIAAWVGRVMQGVHS
jgi:pimeloyl-ACP methyl ester carboxylesterase